MSVENQTLPSWFSRFNSNMLFTIFLLELAPSCLPTHPQGRGYCCLIIIFKDVNRITTIIFKSCILQLFFLDAAKSYQPLFKQFLTVHHTPSPSSHSPIFWYSWARAAVAVERRRPHSLFQIEGCTFSRFSSKEMSVS